MNATKDTEQTTQFLNKQLKTAPQNFHEWMACWQSSDDPLVLLQLLYNGPHVILSSHTAEGVGMIEHYLYVAQDFHNFNLLDAGTIIGRGAQNTILNAPRSILTRAAFEMLCKFALEKKSVNNNAPWGTFAYNDNLMAGLMQLCGGDVLHEDLGQERLHGVFVCAREQYQETLREFCLGLAAFLLEMPTPSHALPEECDRLKANWRRYHKFAIKLLWYLDSLDMLIAKQQYVDKQALEHFKELILSREITVPVSIRSKKEIGYRPKKVEDILRIRPTSWFWHHGGEKIVKAAYLYLGMTAQAA